MPYRDRPTCIMRDRFLAAVMAVLAYAQAFNLWLGRQTYLTLSEIHEFGFAKRLDAALGLTGPNAARGQLGFQTVLAALIVVVGASLAVIVVDRFDTSLGSPSSSALSESQNDILTGFADMASLIGPLLLVGIAVVIIGLLRRAQSA